MNATFLGLEIKRVVRDLSSVFFIAILPAFLYLVFGAATSYSNEPIGNGNVAMYIMIGMAAYGAATATSGIGGRAAVERMQGWGRQLALTPLPDSSYVAIKTIVAMIIATIPIGLTCVLGVLTGAEGTWRVWLYGILALVGGSIVWSLYGLCAGLLFRSEAAVGAAGGFLVVLAFLGNVFVPLTGTLLSIARFTPLYGYVALARYPLTEGYNAEGHESVWVVTVNVTAWALILGVCAVLLVRRGRARQ